MGSAGGSKKIMKRIRNVTITTAVKRCSRGLCSRQIFVDALRRLKIAGYYSLFSIAYCLLHVACLYSATTAEFLRLNPSAASSGGGGTSLAIEGTADSVFLNPVLLASLEKNELSGSYVAWIQNVRYGSFSYAQKLGETTLGFGVLHLGVDGIEGRDDKGVILSEKLSVSNSVFVVAHTRRIRDNFFVGGGLKIFNQSYAGVGNTGAVIDIGAFSNFLKNINWFAALRNLGHSVDGQNMPLDFTVGASYLVGNMPLKFIAEAQNPSNLYLKPRLGVEYNLDALDTVFRLGYEYKRGDVFSGLGGGISFRMNLKPTETLLEENRLKNELALRFDYALGTLGELGVTHRVGISVGF